MGLFQKIFGNRNQRELKKMQPTVARIADLEATMKAKSDAELKAMTGELKQKLDNGATLDDILPEAFATVRETGVRVLKMRHYDVQMIGGMVLHSGKIAEMRTGEGKTLVATLPTYLNALNGKGVHVVTVNDYLAKRDAEWMGRLHGWLGLSTGVIVHGLDDFERQRNYNCDITYGQNNEFGFDYLRDNMKQSPDRMVQRGLHYAVVDEVDSILIDEARTPLIISGQGEASGDLYVKIDRLVPRLKREEHYTVDEKAHSVMLTDEGVELMEKLLEVDNLYEAGNIQLVHHVNQALRAHTLYKRNVNYLVDPQGKVVIISEDTGRAMPGRRWSDGLHQAIEAKEGVTVEEENQTLATVTFQNYFRLYKKLCGMTGTADTEATEFAEIYKLDVTVIPTNRPMQRNDQPDLVYKNEAGKFRAVVSDIEDCHHRGQPVLVGTVSVEKSEVVANLLKAKNLPFNVLNAKQHQREASIIAQAGRKGAITIATNMAGRGTDILLGGNPEAMAKDELEEEKAKLAPTAESATEATPSELDPDAPEVLAPFRGAHEPSVDEENRLKELSAKFKEQCEAEREEVLEAGGLKIIGTERHESRRVDNQLRGRAGRQGDPGASRFYLSLQDDLLRIFGLDKMSGLMERLGLEEDVPIESPMVTRSIEGAQKKVEGRNFDQRKNVLEYDDVMNQQRKTIYAMRRQILEGRYHREPTEEEEKAGIEPAPVTESGDWTFASVSPEVEEKCEEIIDLPKLNEIGRYVRMAYTALPELKKQEASANVNEKLKPRPPLKGQEPWDQMFARLPGTGGVRLAHVLDFYFDIKLPELVTKPSAELGTWLVAKWGELPDGGDDRAPWRVLRAELWRQFSCLVDVEKAYDKPRKELLEYVVDKVTNSLIQQRERLYDLADARMGGIIDQVLSTEKVEDEWDWDDLEDVLQDQFQAEFEISHGTRDEAATQIWPKIEERLTDREKELSRAWLLYFLRHFSLEEIDQQWIEHLKTMEALREGIGLQGYGQKDPKKEYKKAGFTMFEDMMNRIQENTIGKLFKVQIKREDEQKAIPKDQERERKLVEQGAANKSEDVNKEQAEADLRKQTAEARAARRGGGAKPGEPQGNDEGADEAKEPVRRERPKVGRNDPCPCGSGKKYKKCHGKDEETDSP